MNAKEQISSAQMAILMYQTVLGTAILLLPSATTALAGRDMWLTPIIGSVCGFVMVWVAYRLHQYYPDQSIFGYMESILGKYISKIVGFVFLLFNLHILGATVRDYSEFIVGNFFKKTPLIVVAASMVLVCAFAVRAGIEVIARCVQLFIPIVLLLLLLTIFFIIPDMKLTNLQPFLENGLVPPIKGSLVVQGWFCQFVLISYLYPTLKDPHKALKWAHISVAAVTFTMVIMNLAILLLMGTLAGRIIYPVLFASRYIMLADFFEHVEAMIMMIWVLGTFSKLSLFYYTFAVGAADWLKLTSYRSIVLPLGVLITVMSIWVSNNLQELAHFISTSGTFYILTGFVVFPILLWAIASVRRRLSQP
ncbi:spore germination protein [Paenibacillus sp. WQ 127069]|uniref:Spore germination protein n=1 Tax=Paenibacillus baimaensis TaxID=2982185 RepID=A0ABT2UQT2_9BACL|nr:spore germination protein [Paenibacillus sp. WQ 127069]MCU6796376.1 spore germination protein [Paenibacillus sp. WQ 127069]